MGRSRSGGGECVVSWKMGCCRRSFIESLRRVCWSPSVRGGVMSVAAGSGGDESWGESVLCEAREP